MQPLPTSNRNRQRRRHRGSAARRLIRATLFLLSSLGGTATGTSAVTLLLYQPADWRWVWLGAGGLLAGVCAVELIRYFPRDEGAAR